MNRDEFKRMADGIYSHRRNRLISKGWRVILTYLWLDPLYPLGGSLDWAWKRQREREEPND